MGGRAARGRRPGPASIARNEGSKRNMAQSAARVEAIAGPVRKRAISASRIGLITISSSSNMGYEHSIQPDPIGRPVNYRIRRLARRHAPAKAWRRCRSRRLALSPPPNVPPSMPPPHLPFGRNAPLLTHGLLCRRAVSINIRVTKITPLRQPERRASPHPAPPVGTKARRPKLMAVCGEQRT